MIILKLLLSTFLIWLGVICIEHGSSSAFDLGIGLFLFSVFHFIFWPSVSR